MSWEMTGALLAVALFGCLLVTLEAGRRMGLRRFRWDPEAKAGAGPVEGAVFTLLGLLVAFTFSAAASRFDKRRDLILEEANAIGTAYLRLDLLPEADQPALREAFRQYVDARLSVYASVQDESGVQQALARVSEIQAQIWQNAMAAVRPEPRPQVATLVLPALNEMFDISTARVTATRTHVPAMIVVTLFALQLLASALAGYGMGFAKECPRFHMAAFALVMALTTYVILDLEFPRLGVIRVDKADRVLLELRESWK